MKSKLLPNAIFFAAVASLLVVVVVVAAEMGHALDGEVVAVVSLAVGNLLGLAGTLVNNKAEQGDDADKPQSR